MIESHIPHDPRYKIKRAWIAATSERSGYGPDFDLAVEIDCPEGRIAKIERVSDGRNQIVIGVRFYKPEPPKE